MECIKEKKFLFWKYKELEHDYKISAISKFMDCSSTYHVHRECSVCGAKYTQNFVEQDDLILIGIPINELNKITVFKWYYLDNEEV